ncbi:DUF2855 family protein [Streptosporangium sp. NBC_01639]|uniref:DUF2855 family protein n=1 Tax=Streptosporangium sp. NBC_01639 TaxID=2975948 RepID=UPI0038657987|nr:DUF2855 family protein [Streptosporangium sp. NBC_01639]
MLKGRHSPALEGEAADSWDLLVRRDDLTAAEVRPVPHPVLAPGEVRLAVEKFALTMNIVTYARLGDSELPFWAAFPGPAGYGRVPVWAFLRVTDSRNTDIPVGSRYFGFVPMATHHTVAARLTTRGFVDTAPQREFLPSWYRTFQRAAEPDALDDHRAVFRPIFPASFHLADLVAGQTEQGVKSVLITSASSRTAIGLADLLARHGDLPTIGLTSAANVDFVAGLGCYDMVAGYDTLDSVSVPAPAVFVDFTGEHRRISAIYERFPGELAHTALVGYTHPESVQQPPDLAEPEPEIFFTPAVEEQAVADEGEERFYARYHDAEQRFLESTTDWLTIRRQQGPAAVAEVFRALLTEPQPPGVSYLLSP